MKVLKKLILIYFIKTFQNIKNRSALKRKRSPKTEKPSPKPNYIYENYYFTNSKNKTTSTSFATPAPVGSYLML